MKKAILYFIIITVYSISCTGTKHSLDKNDTKSSYPATVLNQDTTSLWIPEGNPENDTVAIFLQGGPKDELNFLKRGRSSWRNLPNYDQWFHIHLHQANTLNQMIFQYEDEFTFHWVY